MKIGIVTQPLSGNYGGILQNYALQQVLKQLGHEPITLDFQFGYKGLPWIFMQLRRIVAKVLGRGGTWKVKYAPSRNNAVINKFINENISVSKKFWNKYSPGLITKYNLEALVVGSDQVWRPRYNQSLEDSFLYFAKDYDIIKLIYAASFGTEMMELSPIQMKMANNLLQSFDAISVRERSGKDNVKRLGYEAEWVLDPTLLLGREGFEKIIVVPKSSDYLGYYILDQSHDTANEIARIMQLFDITESLGMTENKPECGPSEWLGVIKNSKIFVTDSFHGTVFCILFHIPFYTVVNKQRGADRFHSLLYPLGLESRMVDSLSQIDNSNNEIEWSTIDSILSRERENSISFLKRRL